MGLKSFKKLEISIDLNGGGLKLVILDLNKISTVRSIISAPSQHWIVIKTSLKLFKILIS